MLIVADGDVAAGCKAELNLLRSGSTNHAQESIPRLFEGETADGIPGQLIWGTECFTLQFRVTSKLFAFELVAWKVLTLVIL